MKNMRKKTLKNNFYYSKFLIFLLFSTFLRFKKIMFDDNLH